MLSVNDEAVVAEMLVESVACAVMWYVFTEFRSPIGRLSVQLLGVPPVVT